MPETPVGKGRGAQFPVVLVLSFAVLVTDFLRTIYRLSLPPRFGIQRQVNPGRRLICKCEPY